MHILTSAYYRLLALIVILAMLASAMLGALIAANRAQAAEAAQGHPVPAGCWVNVATEATPRQLTSALAATVDNGGTMTVTRNAPWLLQLTVTNWVLNEDAPEWQDLLTDYEPECSALFLPNVSH
jgi:hypothetical protein